MGFNLCDNCRKLPECFLKGVAERDKCDEFDPLSLEEILDRQKFISQIMVGPCPACGSENTVDCEEDPAIEDPTVGHCLECDTYWCIECGTILKGSFICGHWPICAACSEENGYMTPDEFFDKICPKCEFWNGECTLEDLEECEYINEYRCPYEPDVSECPKIRGWKQSSQRPP